MAEKADWQPGEKEVEPGNPFFRAQEEVGPGAVLEPPEEGGSYFELLEETERRRQETLQAIGIRHPTGIYRPTAHRPVPEGAGWAWLAGEAGPQGGVSRAARGLVYSFARLASGIERSAFSVNQLFWRTVKAGKEMVAPPTTVDELARISEIVSRMKPGREPVLPQGWLDKQIEKWNPETHGRITPGVQAVESQISQDVASNLGWVGLAAWNAANAGLDMAEFILEMKTLSALGTLLQGGTILGEAGSAGALLGKGGTLRLVPGLSRPTALRHLVKMATWGAIRTPGEFEQRARSAIALAAYNATPWIANATGLTGFKAVTGDVLLNSFLTSPTYAQIWAGTEGLGSERFQAFAANAIPQFVVDVAMAWNTRGLPENVRRAAYERYLARRAKALGLPKDEGIELLEKLRGLLIRHRTATMRRPTTEELHRAFDGRVPPELQAQVDSGQLSAVWRAAQDLLQADLRKSSQMLLDRRNAVADVLRDLNLLKAQADLRGEAGQQFAKLENDLHHELGRAEDAVRFNVEHELQAHDAPLSPPVREALVRRGIDERDFRLLTEPTGPNGGYIKADLDRYARLRMIEHPSLVPKDEYAPRPDEIEDAEAYTEYVNLRRAWEADAVARISRGDLDPHTAKEMGLIDAPRPDTWTELPDKDYYHVTTAKSAVIREGLKSRWELGLPHGRGLGGGDERGISITESREAAEAIYNALKLARQLYAHDITPAILTEEAKNGGRGAERPFYKDLARLYKPDWQPGDPEPRGLTTALSGWIEKFFHTPRTQEEMEGWKPVGEPVSEGRWNTWRRMQTKEERLDTWYEFLGHWLWARQEAGGPINPLFFLADPQALLEVPEPDIGIVKVRPRPGARGHRFGGLGEWRVYTGEALEVMSKPEGPVGKLKVYERPDGWKQEVLERPDRVRLYRLVKGEGGPKGQQERMRGIKVEDTKALGPTLYHVTPHRDRILASGMLRAYRGFSMGGLGGTNGPPHVSLTSDRRDAVLMARDLRRSIRLLKGSEPVREALERWRTEDERAYGLEPGTLSEAAEAALKDYNRRVRRRQEDREAHGDDEALRKALPSEAQLRWDASKLYRRRRAYIGGPPDPVILGPVKTYLPLDPNQVAIFALPTRHLDPENVLIRQVLETSDDPFLHEVQVHGDIALRDARVVSRTPQPRSWGSTILVSRNIREQSLNADQARDLLHNSREMEVLHAQAEEAAETWGLEGVEIERTIGGWQSESEPSLRIHTKTTDLETLRAFCADLVYRNSQFAVLGGTATPGGNDSLYVADIAAEPGEIQRALRDHGFPGDNLTIHDDFVRVRVIDFGGENWQAFEKFAASFGAEWRLIPCDTFEVGGESRADSERNSREMLERSLRRSGRSRLEILRYLEAAARQRPVAQEQRIPGGEGRRARVGALSLRSGTHFRPRPWGAQ